MFLMAVGMTTVFVFLGLLVALMRGSATFFAAFGHHFPEPEPAAVQGARSPDIENHEEIAIVLAAIEAHRLGRGAEGA